MTKNVFGCAPLLKHGIVVVYPGFMCSVESFHIIMARCNTVYDISMISPCFCQSIVIVSFVTGAHL